jgi:hypothetical protein
MLAFTLEQGPLARRMVAFAGPRPSRETLAELGRRLCDCLECGERFDARRPH